MCIDSFFFPFWKACALTVGFAANRCLFKKKPMRTQYGAPLKRPVITIRKGAFACRRSCRRPDPSLSTAPTHTHTHRWSSWDELVSLSRVGACRAVPCCVHLPASCDDHARQSQGLTWRGPPLPCQRRRLLTFVFVQPRRKSQNQLQLVLGSLPWQKLNFWRLIMSQRFPPTLLSKVCPQNHFEVRKIRCVLNSWTPYRPSNRLSGGLCFWRGGSVRLARSVRSGCLRLRWLSAEEAVDNFFCDGPPPRRMEALQALFPLLRNKTKISPLLTEG
jgi:hypothetical protein